jgi:hypothetical protein
MNDWEQLKNKLMKQNRLILTLVPMAGITYGPFSMQRVRRGCRL